MRLRVIERAQVLGNVSAVCRELGISRTLFYRWRSRLERYGVDGVVIPPLFRPACPARVPCVQCR
jgi:transposase-like protein